MWSLKAIQSGLRCSLNTGGHVASVRNLFSKQELGIVHFEAKREDAQQKFRNPNELEIHKQMFVKNFANYQLSDKRDELKEYIFLMEGKEDEFTTLKSLLLDYTYLYNNSDHRVKKFEFGTPIMRLLYLLNLPDQVIKFYYDDELKSHFDQMQTYKVMLSLLYEANRYEELFKMYDKILKHLEVYELFPEDTINCLGIAACYHLNTPEHLQYALKVWNRAKKTSMMNRLKQLIAALALKQNQPQIAIELTDPSRNFATDRFINLTAFTQLGEFDKAIGVLQRTIQIYKQKAMKQMPTIGKQMLDDLRTAIDTSGSAQQLEEFNKNYQTLESLNLISDETLEQRVCAPFPPMLPKNQFRQMKSRLYKT